MYKIIYCPTLIKVTSVCVHNLLLPLQTHRWQLVQLLAALWGSYVCTKVWYFLHWLLLLLTWFWCAAISLNVLLPYITSLIQQAQDHVTQVCQAPTQVKLCIHSPFFNQQMIYIFAVNLLHHYQITKKWTIQTPLISIVPISKTPGEKLHTTNPSSRV